MYVIMAILKLIFRTVFVSRAVTPRPLIHSQELPPHSVRSLIRELQLISNKSKRPQRNTPDGIATVNLRIVA